MASLGFDCLVQTGVVALVNNQILSLNRCRKKNVTWTNTALTNVAQTDVALTNDAQTDIAWTNVEWIRVPRTNIAWSMLHG